MQYTSDANLPKVTLDELMAARSGTRTYTIVILKRGPRMERAGEERPDEVSAIIMRHGLRNFALYRSGLLRVVCPVADGTDVCGVGIFDASADDVGRIMSGDPAVLESVLAFEIHPTWSFPESTLGDLPSVEHAAASSS